MKRLISFSLWGNDPKYLIGAIENTRLQQEIYPDWVCRFYIDDTVPEDTLKALKSRGAEIVYKERSDGYKGLFWRFEPGFDNTIERFIVRDCDSRLNQREACAVQEWVDSGKSFHCMRDHQGHGIPILGAMWGALSFFIPDYKEVYDFYLEGLKDPVNIKRGKYFYTDQNFLNSSIWPRIYANAIIHDDMKRITGTELPFKIILPPGQFIGQQWGADNKPLITPI